MTPWMIPALGFAVLLWVLWTAMKLADQLERDQKREKERRWQERRYRGSR